ncbi:MAG TPA: AAA family ATPase [Thermoleophilaceae bacterium]|nr:AAA family ATPase [Thermoleophilaceae bacterium]
MKAPTTDREGGGPGASARGPLVGRRSERSELSAALAEAREGRGALFLIAGEPGIGKTRLAEAAAEEAAEAGDSVLWGSAWEAGGAPPYWPWVQAIRELLKDRTAEEMAENLGSGAGYVAQIVPDVGELAGINPGSAPSLDSEATRFSAFDATASFIKSAASQRPIVVVLDDLHAADVATVRLLEFLARNLHGARILAIGTHRTAPEHRDSEIADALAALAGSGRRLVLGGLGRDEVLELAAARAPGSRPDWLIDRIHELTEGNPLFVDEVIRLLTAQGALAEPGALASGRLPLPEGVRDTIRRRLDPLQPATRRVLASAAVIGPRFAVETLAGISGQSSSELVGHLDEAQQARLVEELPEGVGRYRFAHALVRETLYESLGAQERIALHRAVGETLAGLHSHRPDVPLSELAHHFLQAAPAGDPHGRAVSYAARAGELALDSMAYEQAIELFGGALRALDLGPRDPARRGSILLSLGQAEMRAGRLAVGRATLAKAAEVGRQVADPELLARAALASAPWGLATAMSDEQGLVPLLEEALKRLPTADGRLRARVIARLAAAQYWSAPAERRQALAHEAIAMARRVGDPATLAFVLSDAHLATWDPDSPERALPWAGEIYALAGHVGNTELAMAAHSWRISLLLELGEIATADHEIEAFAEAATRLHQQRAQAQSLLHRCARSLIAGDFERAERLLEEAAGYAGLLQQDQILGMRLAALAFVMREAQERLEELEPAVRQFAESQPAMPVWRCALLSVLRQAGRDDELRRQYEGLASDGFASIPRDNLWLPALAFLAEAATRLGDGDGARRLLELLEPYAGRNVVTPDVAYFGPVDRYLALLAATAGQRERAARWFESARALATSMGAKNTCERLDRDEAETLGSRSPAQRAAAAAPAAAGGGRLCRRGDMWELSTGGSQFHLKDAKGLHHLACLLANPGREFHALELVAAAGPATSASAAADPDLSLRRGGEDDTGPLLDARAKAEYRERIGELQEEIEEAEAFHDPERASRARAELDSLTRELSAAVGLGGRDRRGGSSAERARVNVTRSLRATVDRVQQHDAALGHHLHTCIRTGLFCSYDPGPGAARWDVRASG